MVFRWRAVGFRWRGVVGRICPRRNAPLGESLPTRRTSERICPAREGSPQQKPPDTAHERKDYPAQERSPRRKPLDTAHGRKDLPRAETLPSAKASRHGARAKGFAPRGFAFAPRGDERRAAPDRRTAGKTPPRRKPPDTAHERKDLPRARTLPAAKVSRHSARAKGFAPRRNSPHGEGIPTRRTSQRICPAGFAFAPRADERRAALDRRTAGKTPLRRGRTREGAAAAEFIHRKR